MKQIIDYFKGSKIYQKMVFISILLLVSIGLGILILPTKKRETAPPLEKKEQQDKGFELFDTNSWIKGERELKMLELRALKGQLEKEIAAFESVKSAHVILDLRESENQSRASILLTLHEGKRLSESELLAISHHLAGAVRHLDPEKIAISDSKGKVYQTLDGTPPPENVESILQCKIEDLLTPWIGRENFYLTCITSNQSCAILLRVKEEVCKNKEEIALQIVSLVKGFGLDPLLTINPIEREEIHKKSFPYQWSLGLLLFAVALPFVFLPQKKKKASQHSVSPILKLDMKKLAFLIQEESAETIAELLIHLEKEKAKELLIALPERVREGVLFHLNYKE